MHRLSTLLLAMRWRNKTFKIHIRKGVYEFLSDSSSTWHTLIATSLRKKPDCCQAIGTTFHPYDDWFSSSYIHNFSLKMGVLWTRLKFVPPAVLYLLAIMEMRTTVKTMVPAIPPIVIPRMFPWTCLDWHLSPVKKKACPDGHLGKQNTDSVDQEPCHALTPRSSHSLSQMSSSHWRGSSHNIPTLLGGYLHTLEAPQNAEKPALLAAGRN